MTTAIIIMICDFIDQYASLQLRVPRKGLYEGLDYVTICIIKKEVFDAMILDLNL